MLAKTLDSSLDYKDIKEVNPKEISPEYSLEGLMLKRSNNLATWHKELTHWKRRWCWERSKVGGEGDDRGWDGWMASPTQWTWVWVSSGSWWWTGRPGVLQSMGLQRVRHNWGTELNWTDTIWYSTKWANNQKLGGKDKSASLTAHMSSLVSLAVSVFHDVHFVGFFFYNINLKHKVFCIFKNLFILIGG